MSASFTDTDLFYRLQSRQALNKAGKICGAYYLNSHFIFHVVSTYFSAFHIYIQ